VSFKPKKEWFWLGLRLECSEEIEHKLQEVGLEEHDYDPKWGKYWVRLTKAELTKNEALFYELLERAYEEAKG
jgi:hypothetical protein